MILDYAQKSFCGCAKVRALNTFTCFFAIVSRKVILQHFKFHFEISEIKVSTSAVTKSSLNSCFYRFWRHYYISRFTIWFCWSRKLQVETWIAFFSIYFLWKSRLSPFTKFVIWVFCRPQRGKWNLMGCIKSNSEILKFLLSQQMLPRCCLNFSTDS